MHARAQPRSHGSTSVSTHGTACDHSEYPLLSTHEYQCIHLRLARRQHRARPVPFRPAPGHGSSGVSTLSTACKALRGPCASASARYSRIAHGGTPRGAAWHVRLHAAHRRAAPRLPSAIAGGVRRGVQMESKDVLAGEAPILNPLGMADDLRIGMWRRR